MQGARFFMSQNGSNIISFDASRRASSRASRDAVQAETVRTNEVSMQRDRRGYAQSSRVSSHAVGETVSSARGLSYSQPLGSAGADPFASRERSRFSKVTRSGRIQPIGEDGDREASFAANARVSTRPARSSRAASAADASRPSSGFDLGAFSAFDDLDEQLFGSGASRGASSRHSSRTASAAQSQRSARASRVESQAQPRAAVEMFDPNDIEDDGEETSSRGSRRSKRERREKSKAKAKAEKMFNRQFGGEASTPAEAGSRAAVYKGEMGRSHKRAFADLGGFAEKSESSSRRTSQRGQQAKAKHGAPILAYILGAAVCIAVAVLFLYPTAQQFYIESRTQDKLQAEYDQLAERNAAIQSDIDRLSTDEGIQDAAREQLGWVAAGETAGVVVGLDDEDASGSSDAVYQRVDSDDVKTPDTWYSAWLDPLFGYTDGQ